MMKTTRPKHDYSIPERKKSSFVSLLFIMYFFFSCSTPEEKGVNSITEKSAKEYVETLAHDSMEGRKAYTEGSLKAADYIAGCLKDIGIVPYEDSYFQEFEAKDIPILEKGIKSISIPEGKTVRNVIGKIEGKNKYEYIIVGAHYDHLGIRAIQTEDSIYNGADDNASGVSAVLQIAKAFKASKEKPLNTILFALWDAEEMGLVGSKCFVKSFSDMNQIKFYLNLDMIGRDNRDLSSEVAIIFSYTITNQEQFLNDKIEKYGLNIEIVSDMDLINRNFTNNYFVNYEYFGKDFSIFNNNSDHAPFKSYNVPIFLFTTGLHNDYHKHTDHSEMINWGKLTNITKLSFITLFKFANIEM